MIIENIAKLLAGNEFLLAEPVDKHVDQFIGSEIIDGAGAAVILRFRQSIKNIYKSISYEKVPKGGDTSSWRTA